MATTAGPVMGSASTLTGGTGSSSVGIQPPEIYRSNWTDVLAKTTFERKRNERPRALRRRIAARVPANDSGRSRSLGSACVGELGVRPRRKRKRQDILHNLRLHTRISIFIRSRFPFGQSIRQPKCLHSAHRSVNQIVSAWGMDAPNHYSQSPSSQIAG